ncbi:MAG: response regulator [Planctomycetes bacterium]|nr:response regulator [Planctomycetota bacterium]
MSSQPETIRPTSPSTHPPSTLAPGSDGCAGQASAPHARRVMLVDDEENILASLCRLVRREPYEVVTANCGAEALRLMEEQPAQLVITDQRMPGMTGIELLREIQRHWPDTLRMILSGYSEVNTLIAAINEGEIYKFFTKPWNDEELKLHVRRALEQYELEAENRRLTQEIYKQNEKLRELNELLDQRAADATTGLTFAQELLEAIDVGVLTADENGLIVGANRRAKEIVRPPSGELVGIAACNALSDELHEALIAQGTPSDRDTSGRLELEGKPIQWRRRQLGDGGASRGSVFTLWEEVA